MSSEKVAVSESPGCGSVGLYVTLGGPATVVLVVVEVVVLVVVLVVVEVVVLVVVEVVVEVVVLVVVVVVIAVASKLREASEMPPVSPLGRAPSRP